MRSLLSLITLVAVVQAQNATFQQASASSLNTAGFTVSNVHQSNGGGSVCVSGTVRVRASAENLKFAFTSPTQQTDVTQMLLEVFQVNSPTLAELLQSPTQVVSGTWTIGATLCVPPNNLRPKAVQLLTHGFGFDRNNWDFAPGYSYVDIATSHGYAVFFYDRLGIGASDKPDPLNVVQTPLEIEIANKLATMLQSGFFSGVTFSTVIGVGYSYGCYVTLGVAEQHPSTLDATVLIGASANLTGIPPFFLGLNAAIANQNQPERFGALDSGYLVPDSAISCQQAFFRSPNFDPAILAKVAATKQPLTLGEAISTPLRLLPPFAPASDYTNPVMVVNGEGDLPFCDGNCTYPTDLAAQVRPALYPNVAASKFQSLIVPDTGHCVNLHTTATGAFQSVQAFLQQQGLGA
ncbi:hypothetical protein BAUCODRAFT_78619 [Baudoinia panamericana UAMH 10762]|uniref:AB hydrolase-1 domain-containing protein n=1 Tax=Baudoinia panamericana (strain UAMH 10762) TaxID=717646 RepID=M2MM26_BAUPA|nr:uncharacterized protein BAUCODRAFT_78619 [Baudoinia panamericana UAMH 10762]EMC92428.1 hypothetical protein BAUCODRAFT_78619 [Baudoinia panamericana UAMH 10762]